MRLPEANLKDAIVHPEKLVRQEALLYFADSCSRDTGVMPRAIEAIEQYGRDQAFRYIHALTDLAQTEATVDWVVLELHQAPDKQLEGEVYFPHLTRLLCRAEPRPLVPRVEEIVRAPGFDQRLSAEFRERLELAG